MQTRGKKTSYAQAGTETDEEPFHASSEEDKDYEVNYDEMSDANLKQGKTLGSSKLFPLLFRYFTLKLFLVDYITPRKRSRKNITQTSPYTPKSKEYLLQRHAAALKEGRPPYKPKVMAVLARADCPEKIKRKGFAKQRIFIRDFMKTQKYKKWLEEHGDSESSD